MSSGTKRPSPPPSGSSSAEPACGSAASSATSRFRSRCARSTSPAPSAAAAAVGTTRRPSNSADRPRDGPRRRSPCGPGLEVEWTRLVREMRPDWRKAVSWREELPEGWDCFFTDTLAARAVASSSETEVRGLDQGVREPGRPQERPRPLSGHLLSAIPASALRPSGRAPGTGRRASSGTIALRSNPSVEASESGGTPP